MLVNVYALIGDDDELSRLYNTDVIFKKSIDAGYQMDMSTDDILIFALKNGYKEKKNIYDSHLKWILHNNTK